MAYKFNIEPQALKRCFSVYVVIAKGKTGKKLYIGKTGDNRKGCNPVISRCGNHFSYNKIHSQIRNKLESHEDWSYTYVFDHFDEYPNSNTSRRMCIDRINEMERWLNQLIQQSVEGVEGVDVLNPFLNHTRLSKNEIRKRQNFHTRNAKEKLMELVETVLQVLGNEREHKGSPGNREKEMPEH